MKNSSVSVPCQALTRTVLAVRLDGYCQWGDTSLASYNERMVLWPELSPRPQAQVRAFFRESFDRSLKRIQQKAILNGVVLHDLGVGGYLR